MDLEAGYILLSVRYRFGARHESQNFQADTEIHYGDGYKLVRNEMNGGLLLYSPIRAKVRITAEGVLPEAVGLKFVQAKLINRKRNI
ncbi:hypothetical protein PGTUg99_026519 [Puccinia graminis f. sp. tritici]|uniref:Uncharacterized protein n=2 Tax=Puccinia graminis f. sp. tritici TaxID=56615 RepID=E3KE88_PUCGT|nr:uncharacterized protein PGTG_08817 [Puccinia graminis f. sp. tritici CRL 75-36-700-3]EFP82621.2 hypothetical protein PGTG_08817 [Puccinia graminis f. sp. tritici CRL 75-36-700-3]KAA1129315.1 hypothetical protein PGTUg99_026519 [Puccinia graminis f. sp. tritici]